MFCKHCGNQLSDNDKFCESCGEAVDSSEQTVNKMSHIQQPCQQSFQQAPQTIVINNSVGMDSYARSKQRNKWIALLLCLFLGWLGAHKFYEGKYIMGILYMFTAGLFGIGIFFDCIALLFKPNPYFV